MADAFRALKWVEEIGDEGDADGDEGDELRADVGEGRVQAVEDTDQEELVGEH